MTAKVSFRPSKEVSAYLYNLQEGTISAFINNSIKTVITLEKSLDLDKDQLANLSLYIKLGVEKMKEIQAENKNLFEQVGEDVNFFFEKCFKGACNK
jgi:hypothetical protein